MLKTFYIENKFPFISYDYEWMNDKMGKLL